jgi:hypothetical protein
VISDDASDPVNHEPRSATVAARAHVRVARLARERPERKADDACRLRQALQVVNGGVALEENGTRRREAPVQPFHRPQVERGYRRHGDARHLC